MHFKIFVSSCVIPSLSLTECCVLLSSLFVFPNKKIISALFTFFYRFDCCCFSINASDNRNSKETIYDEVQTAKLERSAPPKEPEIAQVRGELGGGGGGGGRSMYKMLVRSKTFRNHQNDALKIGNRFSCANKKSQHDKVRRLLGWSWRAES